MGREWQQSNNPKLPNSSLRCPPGIEIRKWKSGRTTLRIQFYYQGVLCRETLKLEATANNIKYTERLRGEIINAIERNNFNYSEFFPKSKKAVQFGHVSQKTPIDELLVSYLKQAEISVEKSTYLGYRKVCEAHLFSEFDKVFIQNLTPAMIRNWISSLKLSHKTIKNILIPLRAVITQALIDGLIDTNPLDKVFINKLVNKKYKNSDYQVDPFHQEEIERILSAADGQLKNQIQFAFFTGLRPSELIALRWDDINWFNNTVRISKGMVCREEKGTKTPSGVRDVLLLPPALQALQDHKAYTFLNGQSQHIFHNPHTNKPWEDVDHFRNRHWINILKRANVRYRNPYQTRHTYASMMLSKGENIMWLVTQMGHVDVEMVSKTYGKWIPDNSIRAGYQPKHDWGSYLNDPSMIPQIAAM